MANDYQQARQARKNVSRIVVEGVDEPAKNFASNVPKGYTSPDVEDRRRENILADKAAGTVNYK